MPVYMIQAGGEHGPVKIGVTDDVEKRLIGMQTGNHQPLVLIRLFEGGPNEERALHQRFADLRLNGEWFSFSKQMLGDVGLIDMERRRNQQFIDRMDELSERYTKLGPKVLNEITDDERAALRAMWRLLTTPLWQNLGLSDPHNLIAFPTKPIEAA
jgi:hypothetical protein